MADRPCSDAPSKVGAQQFVIGSRRCSHHTEFDACVVYYHIASEILIIRLHHGEAQTCRMRRHRESATVDFLVAALFRGRENAKGWRVSVANCPFARLQPAVQLSHFLQWQLLRQSDGHFSNALNAFSANCWPARQQGGFGNHAVHTPILRFPYLLRAASWTVLASSVFSAKATHFDVALAGDRSKPQVFVWGEQMFLEREVERWHLSFPVACFAAEAMISFFSPGRFRRFETFLFWHTASLRPCALRS